MRITKVTIISQQPKKHSTVNDSLLLFGHMLGLFGIRDKDKSCYRVFITLVRAMKRRVELTSDELALQTGLSRGTVIHHLNRLMDAGIVTNFRNTYAIDSTTLTQLVEKLRAGVNAMFDDISEVAGDIDSDLGL